MAPPVPHALRSPDAPEPHRWRYPAVIVLAGLLAYANSFGGAFLLDDNHAIVNNLNLRTLPPTSVRLWQPRYLAYVTLSLNYRLDRLNVRGYHAVNLAIHIAAALVLYGLVRRTLLRCPANRHAAALALAVSLLWVVHPLQTQSVTYLVQRLEALMGLFFLLTLYCLLRGADSPSAAGQRGWYALSVLSCALGMMSKEVMVAAPLVALLYDRIFLTSSWREVWRRRGLVHLGLAATWLLLAAALGIAVHGDGPSPSAGFAVRLLTPWQYARSQPGVLLHYLRLCFWPHPLCLDYAWPVADDPWQIVPAALAVAGLLCLTGWALWRRPRLGFLAVCCFLILAPTSTVMPLFDLAAEHRLYLPLAAILTLAVLGAAALLGALARRAGWTEAALRRRATALLGVTACLLAALTHLRNVDYQSPLSMWGAVVELRPDNPRARHNLATELQKVGRLDDAEREYRAAARLRPAEASWRQDLIVLLLAQGRADEAEQQLRDLFRHAGPDARAYEQLGLFLAARGKSAEAAAYLEEALRLDPGLDTARAGLRRLHAPQAEHLDP